MIRRGVGLGLLTLAATVMIAADGVAQSVAVRAAAGATIEYYKFTDEAAVGLESITLITTPFGARASIGPVVSVSVTGAFASATLKSADGTESTLEGLVDTRATVDIRLIENGLTLSGMFIAPTGEARHSTEEALVAGVVAADLLPFHVTNWGTGGGVGVQLAGTRRFSGVGAGFSVSYRRAEDFEPITGNSLVYQPGNEVRVRIALDANVGGGTKASLVVGFQDFSDDEIDGANLFQSGQRFEVMGTLAFPTGYRGSGALYGGVLHREKGQFLDPAASDAPSQDLVLLGGLLRQPALGGWFAPRADVRVFRSGDGQGQGYVAGLGLSMEWGGDGRGTTWIPSLTGRFGNVEISEGNESSIVGFEAGLTIRFGR